MGLGWGAGLGVGLEDLELVFSWVLGLFCTTEEKEGLDFEFEEGELEAFEVCVGF